MINIFFIRVFAILNLKHDEKPFMRDNTCIEYMHYTVV